MPNLPFADLVGAELAGSLTKAGFTELTKVQAAVLEPSLADHDLRITSQTGSGKTVAIGLLLRHEVRSTPAEPAASSESTASSESFNTPFPRILVVVPTRELAKQVRHELSWLYAPLGVRLACVTGGSNFRDERRSLAQRPAVVVGTPGRLLDHLNRGSIDATAVSTIVLDEADRMLDLGFSEDIHAIFAAATNRKHCHLVSATLEPAVLKLADRYQTKAHHVQGTRYGEAHADIDHVVYLVDQARRFDALSNLLLMAPDERTLVFARTRADVAAITDELWEAGFKVTSLSGDMEQVARDRALKSFREGRMTVMVATDVAARGIDVQNTTRVIHFDPPTDAESYTHRSGRTGRAGQKGTSILLVPPARQRALRVLFAQARVNARLMPLPTPDQVRDITDQRLVDTLLKELSQEPPTDRLRRLAERLLADRDPVEVVSQLVGRGVEGEPEVRDFVPYTAIPERRERVQRHRGDMPQQNGRWGADRAPSRGYPQQGGRAQQGGQGGYGRQGGYAQQGGQGGYPQQGGSNWEHGAPRADSNPGRNAASAPRTQHPSEAPPPYFAPATPSGSPLRGHTPGKSIGFSRAAGFGRTGGNQPPACNFAREAGFSRPSRSADTKEGFGTFRVTWGEIEGADPRRMLAVVCRRGGIQGADVGAIRIGRTATIVEVRSQVAGEFALRAVLPDPEEPQIRITPISLGDAPRGGHRAPRPRA